MKAQDARMPSWSDVRTAAPELAEKVSARLNANGLSILATLRADGFPRISPIEALVTDDEIWLGMMYESRKALDLLRDPRMSLHNATDDKNVAKGDAKLVGRAVEADIERARKIFAAATGHPPEGPMHAFTVDVLELSFLMPAGDHLDIDIWRAGEAPRRVERF